MSIKTSNWSNEVLDFWFEKLDAEDWFKSSAELDAMISQRFSPLHRELRNRANLPEPFTAEIALAAVIVLDQFSRNMFRGTRDAFKYDPLALTLTKQALDLKLHNQLEDKQKMFLLMPLMHSETMADQDIGLSLFTGKTAESAVEHRDIIREFGRFPHRNAVLGRVNTPAEIEFLKHGRRFGQ